MGAWQASISRASHNPKEYNGIKRTGVMGAQLQTETAMAVSARLEEIDVFAGPKRMDLQRGIELGRICLLGRSCDEAYLKAGGGAVHCLAGDGS